ncbi:MAG TPA: RsmE family RNA methyltransferase, partial [Kofleriaceae bacterium]|nr:RsmE family RNA methyltransferase [Kofleriaceae bacterium]
MTTPPRCRLWVPPAVLQAGPAALRGDDHHYLARVRRLRAGDTIELFDGEGRAADAVIEAVGADEVTVAVGEPRAAAAAAARPRMRVLMPLLKGDRTDWCVQKLVELGADEIVFVRCARSVVRVDGERARTRLARLQAVARDAARQCGRADLPALAGPVELAEAVGRAADPGGSARLLFWERARDLPLAAALPAGPVAEAVLLIGPEGGLEPGEVEAAQASGFAVAGLGPRILR